MRRRGVAMLMVLGASVVLLTLAGVAAGSRVRAGVSVAADRSLVAGLRIAGAAEDAIGAWLGEASGDVVLPADAVAPGIVLMDSRLRVGDELFVVTIAAWDQHGMLERGWLGWGGMPGWVGAVAGDRAGDRGGDRAGDRFGGALAGDGIGGQIGGLDEVDGERVFPAGGSADGLGGLVATHRARDGARRRRVAVNVNTAPLWLLGAMGVDSGSIGIIRGQRARGETVDVSSLAMQAGARGERTARLTGESGVWSFRVDVTSAGARVSVWLVYARLGGVWVREQRLVIDR